MSDKTPDDTRGQGRALTPWLSWLLGPLAWGLHQNASFSLTGWVCQTGNINVLHLVSLCALLIAAIGIWIAWRDREAGSPARHDAPARTLARRRFLAVAGGMICVLSFAGILLESVPNFVLHPCLGAT